MQVKNVELNSREQTAKNIYEIAKKFKYDLLPFKDWSLDQFYNYVHNIPFVNDSIYSDSENDYEVVTRPLYLLDREAFPEIDCKKKTTLFAAFAEMQGWTYIITAISEYEGVEPHHVYMQLWTGDDWLPVDANLPEYYLFKPKPEIIAGELF